MPVSDAEGARDRNTYEVPPEDHSMSTYTLPLMRKRVLVSGAALDQRERLLRVSDEWRSAHGTTRWLSTL